jgi:hypothetical protein
MSTKSTDGARRLLKRALDAVAARLHAEAEVPTAASPAGDLLDTAQSVLNQELERLNAGRCPRCDALPGLPGRLERTRPADCR